MKLDKYNRWINKNCSSIRNKTILLNGVTGGIGKAVTYYLASLKNKLIFLVRNTKEAEIIKKDLIEKYNIEIEIIFFDLLDKNSLDEALNNISDINDIDVFINISGIYHQKEEIIDGIEKTYIVNYLNPAYFIKKLLILNPRIKTIIVSSITYSIKKIKENNFESFENYSKYLNSIKNKTIKYGFSKHLLMQYLISLSNKFHYKVIFVHPGVSKTNLFSKKNKAYGKAFYLFVPKMMDLIFMKPEKACLSILKAINEDNLKERLWIGPRGFLKFWGYPSICKLRKSLFDEDSLNLIYKETEEYFKRIKE